jgi:hypothetical protein
MRFCTEESIWPIRLDCLTAGIGNYGDCLMGMTELTTKLLMEQSRLHDFGSCRLLTIGRQGITFSVKDLSKWARDFNFKLSEPNLQNALVQNRRLTDTEYFLSLGFQSVESLDVSEYEEASIICNLNQDLPLDLQGKFDVVYDGGSTEHMFNVPKAFENYNKLLKVGGLIMHALPSTGNLDHGFYMFSPTLFHDYYSQNKWSIKTNYMLQLPYDNMNSWNIYEYSAPGPFLEHIEFKGRWGMFFVAQKQSDSTFDTNISQHYFKTLWQNTLKEKSEENGAASAGKSKNAGALKKLFRMLPENVKAAIRLLILAMKRLPFLRPKIPFKKLELR